MTKKKAPQNRRAKAFKQTHGISAEAQRQRLLKALREGPVTTLQARSQLDILHPAGRVQELRKQGIEIATHWLTAITSGDRKHRVAQYVLFGGRG